MKTLIALLLSLCFVGAVRAENAHFVGSPECTDQGTSVQCSGKVAGLGGTVFQIDVRVPGEASVACTNHGGHTVPGKSFTTMVVGTGGPKPTTRNGQSSFVVETSAFAAPADSCPNRNWTATVTEVMFGNATVTVSEDGVESDTAVVVVQ